MDLRIRSAPPDAPVVFFRGALAACRYAGRFWPGSCEGRGGALRAPLPGENSIPKSPSESPNLFFPSWGMRSGKGINFPSSICFIHDRQYTGLLPSGLNGTVVFFPQFQQMVSCILPSF